MLCDQLPVMKNWSGVSLFCNKYSSLMFSALLYSLAALYLLHSTLVFFFLYLRRGEIKSADWARVRLFLRCDGELRWGADSRRRLGRHVPPRTSASTSDGGKPGGSVQTGMCPDPSRRLRSVCRTERPFQKKYIYKKENNHLFCSEMSRRLRCCLGFSRSCSVLTWVGI